MIQNTPSNETQYRLSKKVAQLTKVIAHLNSVNENYAAHKQQIIEKEINGKQTVLQEELRRLQDLIASSEVKEKEANEQLVSFQNEARAKEEELQRNHEMLRVSHAETVRRMSQTFEEESRRYQENTLCVRNELADGYKQRMEKLREEINSSHADEIQLLKSRHEKNILRLEHEASEQTKLAAENAVAKTRLEYEDRLAQQTKSHNEICEGMRTEAMVLHEELARLTLQVNEVPILKDNLAAHIDHESKLQLDVISLQKSIESVSNNHQKVVMELQMTIVDFGDELQTTRGSLQNRLEQNKSLEIDNINLKSLIGTIEAQKSFKESELKALSETLLNERKRTTTQLEESESRRQNLQSEVDRLNNSNDIISGKISLAISEIEELSKYKQLVVQQLHPLLQSLKTDVEQSKVAFRDLTRLIPPFVVAFDEWKRRVTTLHTSDFLRFHEREQALRDHVDKLQSVIERQDVSLVKAEETIKNIEETAHSINIVRIGERLSWEKAMEDLKVQHKNECSRLCCKAQDEADILGNEIAELHNTIKKQNEDHDRKCRHIMADSQRKMDNQDAALSRIKYESALEVQGMSLQLDQLNASLVSKERDMVALANENCSLKKREVIIETEHHKALEALSRTHQSKLEEMERFLEELIRQKNDELQKIEREMESASAIHHLQISESMVRISSEYFMMTRDVATIKSLLGNLRVQSLYHAEGIQQEWEYLCSHVIASRLKSMKRKYDATAERNKVEMEQLRESHAKEEETFRTQLAVSEKETQNAKAMLFNNIRENIMSIERALYQQAKQHRLEIETQSNESALKFKAIAAQLDQLSKENKSLVQENAKRADAIVAKDKELAQAAKQTSNALSSCKEEVRAMEVHHESERQRLINEFQCKEVSMVTKFLHEKSELQAELRTQKDEANKRWNSRPSLPNDIEQIKALRNEIQKLNNLSEQLELENRENASCAVKKAPLRLLQTSSSGSTAESANASGKSGASIQRKSESSKLPKITK